MGDFFIKLLGARGARVIEQGSLLGAAIGALIFGSLGILLVYIYDKPGLENTYGDRIAHEVSFGVVGSLVGGTLGSLFRRRKKPPTISADIAQAITPFRLTNLNAALGKIGVFVIVLAFVPFGIYAEHADSMNLKPNAVKKVDHLPPIFIVMYFILLAGFFWVACKAILWVDIDKVIRVRRLFSTKEYTVENLRDWVFASEDHRTRTPPSRLSTLVLLMNDGMELAIPVTPPLARQVVNSFQIWSLEHSPRAENDEAGQ